MPPDTAEVEADVVEGTLPLASKTHQDRYCLMFACQVCRFGLVIFEAQMFNQFFYFAMKKSKELIKSLETLKNQVYSLSRAAKMQRCEYLISEIGLTIEFIKDLEFYCAL